MVTCELLPQLRNGSYLLPAPGLWLYAEHLAVARSLHGRFFRSQLTHKSILFRVAGLVNTLLP